MSPSTSPEHHSAADAHDSHPPAEMARLVESVGVSKARLPLLDLCVLGLLAGAFISFGGMLYTVVITGAEPVTGMVRWAGGIGFSLGLVLVIVGGAELFTGNNLIVMAWASRRVGTLALLRNWVVVYLANLAGSLGSVALVWTSGILDAGTGAVGRTAAAIAADKLELGFVEAFSRGILCNALVCLAVWLCFASRDVAGKVL